MIQAMENIIITLSNGHSYKILKETAIEDKRYCFATLLTEDEQETEEYMFFVIINRDGKEIMKLVEDNSIKEQLLVLLTSQYCQFTETLGGV